MASSTSSNLPDGDDLKQRVARVEGIAHDLIERQLRTITVIFGLVSAVIVAAGVLVSVLAIYGKIEVRDATREMERKFEVLAGQALKVPVLQILYEGTRPKGDYCQGAHWRCVAVLRDSVEEHGQQGNRVRLSASSPWRRNRRRCRVVVYP